MSAAEAKTTKVKTDKKTAEMMERAKVAQEQARSARKLAPDVALTNPMGTIPQKVLIEKYAKRDGFRGQDDPTGKHYMFGDRDETDLMPDRGYEPVLEMSSGGTMKQVVYQGDPMWCIPTDIYQGRVDDGARRSTKIAKAKAAAETEKASKSPVSSGEKLQTAKTGTSEADAILAEAGLTG